MKPRLLAAAVLLAGTASAQRVMFQPVSLTVSNSALGSGRDVGLWTVSVSLPAGKTCSSVQILMAAPTVKAIPNRQAEVLINRKAFRDPRTTWARAGKAALQLAPIALTAAGVMTGSSGYSWAGVGMAGLTLILPALQQRAPDPAFLAAADLLPDLIDRTGRWLLVASLTHEAAPIGPLNLECGR
jgi:hypothetical protein